MPRFQAFFRRAGRGIRGESRARGFRMPGNAAAFAFAPEGSDFSARRLWGFSHSPAFSLPRFGKVCLGGFHRSVERLYILFWERPESMG